MPQYQIKTKVTRVERLSEENMRLTLEAPDIARVAKPGQFVMIKASLGSDPLLRRPFSIHQVDSAGHIQIYFKIFVFRFLFENFEIFIMSWHQDCYREN